ncbi:GATOR complex protein MIOS-like isoform X2 [Acanthaster planci]|uniref:GATOR complex protein MIOS-like isoform X2 n=1 Tax=Acanthaster planci TaxID=133434 RepID=A0A8B7ZQG8_ACAPL|nr:GATOR complex protein MIOS-like isoform X2 [Acanthaster planci]
MSSSAGKWELEWSPSDPDVFLAFSSDRYDLNLYAVESEIPSSGAQCQQISQDSHFYARLQASKADLHVRSKGDLQLIRCFAWYPKQSSDDVIALGLSSGKVILSGFCVDSSVTQAGLVGKEFPLKHTKMCTCLAWNTVESKWLAAGFDRYRTDYCMAVYDVNSQTNVTELNVTPEKSRYVSSHNAPQSGFRPVTEMVQAEVLNSMAWLPHQPHCIVAGVANKNLRIFDVRDTAGYKIATATKSVYGVSADPQVDYRLSSYHEGQVNIWDHRHFDKPVLTINEARQINKLAWSPSRYGLLASLSRDSSVVKLYNVQHVCSEVEYTERLLQPVGGAQVSTFAWHPTCENRILTITHSGVFRDVAIHDPVSLTLSPQSTCMLASGKNLLLVTAADNHQVQDISVQMKQRAINGYGLQNLLSQNSDLLGDSVEEVNLKKFWTWLDRFLSLHKEDKVTASVKGGARYCGVKSLLKSESGLKSCVDAVDWKGVDWYSESNVFRSPERSAALMLCGWEFDHDEVAFSTFINRLVEKSEYERAAAICVFQLRLRQAIDVLNRATTDAAQNDNSSLHGMAMALSGFTQQRNTLWCEMCSTLREKLKHPYLRAMFGFLTAFDDTFDVVLKEPGLNMEDRVAFACLFLNDQQLPVFIEELTNITVQDGKLEGMLLAGLNKDCVELLQSYVDRTADIQTASLVAVLALPPELCKDKRVTHWVESYRGLLDTWRLWHQRARFDVYYHHDHQGNVKVPSPQQVFVNCHFCQSAISPTVLAQRSLHTILPHLRGPMHQRVKASTCYKCRKPLPRCALCLMNMGTLSGLKSIQPQDKHSSKTDQQSVAQSKQTDFSQWFTWCQSCRHGGHACHLTEWFKEHTECPVTGCTCRCMLMDSAGTIFSATASTT